MMTTPSAEAGLLGVCLLGVGGSVLGLIGLLAQSISGRSRKWFTAGAVVLAAAGLAALAGAAVTYRLSPDVWLGPAALAAACMLFWTLRSAWLPRACAAVLGIARRPPVQWAALLALSPALAL